MFYMGSNREYIVGGEDVSMVNLNLHTIVLIVLCHLIGDYVLQCDFIAQTKGKNWYHLFVHCALYCVPFLVVFGWTWQLVIIFISENKQIGESYVD